MPFLIFANRANIQYNREFKENIRPCWFVYMTETEQLVEAKEFTITGSFRSVVDFAKALPLKHEHLEITGPINCWLHVEGDGLFFN